jgi:hypothetical protein
MEKIKFGFFFNDMSQIYSEIRWRGLESSMTWYELVYKYRKITYIVTDIFVIFLIRQDISTSSSQNIIYENTSRPSLHNTFNWN